MSTADEPSVRRAAVRRTLQAGYTALEIMIAVGILALMSLVVERTLASTHEAERYLGGIRKATERGQRLAYELREVVSSSRKLFQDDAIGQGYLEALDLYALTKPLKNARLPVFDEVNGLGPDTPGDPRTGNMLLFVREADAAPAIADPATGKQRYVDTYRFVCVYISESDLYIVQEENRKLARDLIFWRSIAYPSHGQIMSISDPVEQANVVRDLVDRFGYEYCWDANGPVDGAFYAMDALGTVSSTPASNMTIDLDVDMIERGKLVYAKVQLARTDASSHARRTIFAADDPATWTPDGFEVKVVGTSGSRKVWMHVVIETQAAKGKVAVHGSTVIASTKDL